MVLRIDDEACVDSSEEEILKIKGFTDYRAKERDSDNQCTYYYK